MRKTIYIILLLILLLSACSVSSSETSVLQGDWKLTEYGTAGSMTPAVEEAGAALSFADDGTLTGSGGCNSLGGEYEFKGNEVSFGPITSTLMACDDARNAQESFVTQVLTGTAQFEVNGDALTITNGDKVLVFSK